MPRTKRKQQDQDAAAPEVSSKQTPAAVTVPIRSHIDGGGDLKKQKRKRRKKARTEVSDSSSSSSSESDSDSDSESEKEVKRKPESKKTRKEKGGLEVEGNVDALDGTGLKKPAGLEDGDAEMKDVDDNSSTSEEDEGDQDESDDDNDNGHGPKRDFAEKPQRIPEPLLQRAHTDTQSAQRFEEYYMQLVTSEFGEELNQVRKAKDFNERSLPMLVRALRMGVNIFDAGEKKAVVGSLGLV